MGGGRGEEEEEREQEQEKKMAPTKLWDFLRESVRHSDRLTDVFAAEEKKMEKKTDHKMHKPPAFIKSHDNTLIGGVDAKK